MLRYGMQSHHWLVGLNPHCQPTPFWLQSIDVSVPFAHHTTTVSVKHMPAKSMSPQPVQVHRLSTDFSAFVMV